jgi:hypothetical protein
MRTVRIDFQEFIEQLAIVDHCLTHFFSTGLPPLPPQRKRASGAVILNDHWMIDRQVVRTPVEVFQRVATRCHHLGDELIGFPDGTLRVVHEARLNATPLACERVDLILTQLPQVETADALGTLSQHRLSTRRPDSLNGSFVLRSKTFAQVRAPAAVRVRPGRNREQHDNDDTDEHKGL